MLKKHKKRFAFFISLFILCVVLAGSNALPVKAYSSAPDSTTNIVVTVDNSDSWLGDERNTDKIYGRDTVNTPHTKKDDKDEPLAVRWFKDLMIKAANGLSDLFWGFGCDLDSIIFGRVSSHRKINYFAFELTTGNVFGFIGTRIYNLFAWLAWLMLVAVTIFKVATGVYSGNSPQKRAEMKEKLLRIPVLAMALYIMPYLYDILQFMRDIILKIVFDAVSGLTEKGSYGILETFESQSKDGFIYAFLYLAACIVSLFFAYAYLQLAISMMIYFVMFPMVCVLSLRDKSVFDNWVSTLIASLLTPVVDGVLFMIPCVLIGQTSGNDMFSFLALLVCMIIIPSRHHIYRLLNINNDSNFGGALNFLAAARAAGALAKKAKNTFSKAAEATSELKAAFDTKKKDKMNKELDDLDREEENEMANEVPLQDVGEMMSKSKGEKEPDGSGSESAESLSGSGVGVLGKKDAEQKGDSSQPGSSSQGYSYTSGVGAGFSATTSGVSSGVSGAGFGKMDEAVAETNDAVALSNINNDISSMNTALNGINVANAGLQTQKAEYMDQAASARESVSAYDTEIRELQGQNREIDAMLRGMSPDDEQAQQLQAQRSNNEQLIENAKNNRNIATARLNEANANVRSTDRSIASNNEQIQRLNAGIQAAKGNAQAIKDNANIRKSQIAYNNASKAQARRAILDKYANVSNFNSPEFKDISPERRVELERKLHLQNAKKAAFQAAGGATGIVVGGTFGAAAGLFHGADKTFIGAAAGSAVGGSIGEVAGSATSAVASASYGIGKRIYHKSASTVLTAKALSSPMGSVAQGVYTVAASQHRDAGRFLPKDEKITAPTVTVNATTPTSTYTNVRPTNVAQGTVDYNVTRREVNQLGNMLKSNSYNNSTLREQMDSVFASRNIDPNRYRDMGTGSFDDIGFTKQVRAVVREACSGMSNSEIEIRTKLIVDSYKNNKG